MAARQDWGCWRPHWRGERRPSPARATRPEWRQPALSQNGYDGGGGALVLALALIVLALALAPITIIAVPDTSVDAENVVLCIESAERKYQENNVRLFSCTEWA